MNFKFFLLIVLLVFLFILLLLIWYGEGMRYVNLNGNEKDDLLRLDREYKNIRRVKSKMGTKVVVSLTTIPDRINKLIPTLSSIYNQSVRVDEIRLNIPYVSRRGKGYKIPTYFECSEDRNAKLLKRCKYIKVKRVAKDVGPSTKLLPTVRDEEEDTRIIVIDDDQIYGSCFIEKLVETFEEKKGKVAVTNYGAKFKASSWDRVSTYGCGGGYVDILFGCGGYILIPKMLPKEVFDYSIAPESAIYVDDNWISGWLRHNNVKIYMMGLKKGTCFFLSQSTLHTLSLSSGPNKNKKHEKIVNKWFRDLEN